MRTRTGRDSSLCTCTGSTSCAANPVSGKTRGPVKTTCFSFRTWDNLGARLLFVGNFSEFRISSLPNGAQTTGRVDQTPCGVGYELDMEPSFGFSKLPDIKMCRTSCHVSQKDVLVTALIHHEVARGQCWQLRSQKSANVQGPAFRPLQNVRGQWGCPRTEDIFLDEPNYFRGP